MAGRAPGDYPFLLEFFVSFLHLLKFISIVKDIVKVTVRDIVRDTVKVIIYKKT